MTDMTTAMSGPGMSWKISRPLRAALSQPKIIAKEIKAKQKDKLLREMISKTIVKATKQYK